MKIPKDLSFEYKILPSYNIYIANGVHGGLSADGRIMMNFYSERRAIPKKETFALNPDGSLGKGPSLIDSKDSVIRNVFCGISIDPIVARSIAAWLIEKADEYDKTFKNIKERTDNVQ